MSDTFTNLVSQISATSSPKIKAALVQGAKELLAAQTDIGELTGEVAKLKDIVAGLQNSVPSDVWTIGVPGSTGKPVTIHPYSSGINLNIQMSGSVYSDHDFPEGSGDTTVLVGSGGRFVNGATLRRFRLRKVAVGNTVPYGKHGFYLDGYNLLLEDIDVEAAPPAASCLSIRMGGTVVRRAVLTGRIPIGIFDSDTGQSNGMILLENGNVKFDGDTAIWCDAQVDFKTTFDLKVLVRNYDFFGPGAVLKAASVRNGTFRLENCRLNGKPITSASVPTGSVIV